MDEKKLKLSAARYGNALAAGFIPGKK